MSSAFPVIAAALWVGAAALVILLPRVWRRGGSPETNEDWLRLRQRELAAESEALKEEAALRLIEDGVESDSQSALAVPRYSGRGQALAAVGLAATVWLLYWQLGGWEDVQIAEHLGRIEQSEPEAVLALIDRMTARAEARPNNADYSLLLGEYYLSGNEPAQALRYYDRLIDLGATAPEILGKAAQSEFLSSGRVLNSRARSRAEQALALDPMQAAALATLGMAGFEEGDYRQAIVYWQRLRELEPPGSPGYEMLGQVIERAKMELGETVADSAVSSGIGVDVTVSAEGGLPAGGLLFVLARPEGAESGMPIAVVRTTATAWPVTVRLDDSASMAGQRISDFKNVSVEVQVSGNGEPGRENAVAWEAIPSFPVGESSPLRISLQVE